MKKFILTAFIIVFTAGIVSAAGFDAPPITPLGNEIGNMQNTNNQMRLMNQQRFRQEEYNDYKDNMQTVKSKRAQEYKQYQEEKEKLYSPSQNIDFVNENGRIILKSTN